MLDICGSAGVSPFVVESEVLLLGFGWALGEATGIEIRD